MPLFETNIQQVTTVTNSAALIWDPDNTSQTTFGALGSITAGDVLKDLVIVNQGTAVVYVGSGTAITASASTGAFQIPAGGTLLLQGYNVTSTANSTTGDIYGITSAGSSQVTVGLASVASVV